MLGFLTVIVLFADHGSDLWCSCVLPTKYCIKEQPQLTDYLCPQSSGVCSVQTSQDARRRVSSPSSSSVPYVVSFVFAAVHTVELALISSLQYCFGNAIGAQVFQDRWAPAYRPSTIILSIMFALEFVLMGVWRIYCKRARKDDPPFDSSTLGLMSL